MNGGIRETNLLPTIAVVTPLCGFHPTHAADPPPESKAQSPAPSAPIVFGRAAESADAGATRADTLLDVYQLARRNDPRYKAARYEFEAVALGVREAMSGFLPTIAYDLGLGRI